MAVTLLETSIISGIYMSYIKGSFSIMHRRKDRFYLLNGCGFVGTKEHQLMICFRIVTLITILQQYRVLISLKCIWRDIPSVPSTQVELFTRSRNWTDTKPSIASVREGASQYSQEGGLVRSEAKRRAKSRKDKNWTERMSKHRCPNSTEFAGHPRFKDVFFIYIYKKRVETENF